MIETILLLLVLFMMPFALFGLYMFIFTLIIPMKAPCDTSNRIAHLRLVWFAISKPELSVKIFPWLTRDEGDNLKE